MALSRLGIERKKRHDAWMRRQVSRRQAKQLSSHKKSVPGRSLPRISLAGGMALYMGAGLLCAGLAISASAIVGMEVLVQDQSLFTGKVTGFSIQRNYTMQIDRSALFVWAENAMPEGTSQAAAAP